MKHEHVIEHDLIGRYRRDELPPTEAEAFEGHLIGCRECQSLLAVDARLERGMRSIEVREARPRAYAWRSPAPLAAAAVLVLAVGSTAALWLQDRARPESVQAELPIYHLALDRGSDDHATVLKIPSNLVWYALEVEAPAAGGECCRVIIEDADGAMVWQGESPMVPVSNTVRVLLSRSFMGSGTYRIVLYADGPRRLIEHQVQVELTR